MKLKNSLQKLLGISLWLTYSALLSHQALAEERDLRIDCYYTNSELNTSNTGFFNPNRYNKVSLSHYYKGEMKGGFYELSPERMERAQRHCAKKVGALNENNRVIRITANDNKLTTGNIIHQKGLLSASLIKLGIYNSPNEYPIAIKGQEKLVVFGDSLSDTGDQTKKIKINNAGFLSVRPYWNFRYSNGPVWNDFLRKGFDSLCSAENSGAEAPVVPAISNWAFGGATSGTVNYKDSLYGKYYTSIIKNLKRSGRHVATGDTLSVIDKYLLKNNARTPGGGIKDNMFTIWTGANDYINDEDVSYIIADFQFGLNKKREKGGHNFSSKTAYKFNKMAQRLKLFSKKMILGQNSCSIEPDRVTLADDNEEKMEGMNKFVDRVTDNIISSMKKLCEQGGHKFLLMDLPDLSLTPMANTCYIHVGKHSPMSSEEIPKLVMQKDGSFRFYQDMQDFVDLSKEKSRSLKEVFGKDAKLNSGIISQVFLKGFKEPILQYTADKCDIIRDAIPSALKEKYDPSKGLKDAMKALASSHNKILAKKIDIFKKQYNFCEGGDLSEEGKLKIQYVQVGKIVDGALNNADKYGITDKKEALWNKGLGTKNYTTNASATEMLKLKETEDSKFFADLVHPTSMVHCMLAIKIIQEQDSLFRKNGKASCLDNKKEEEIRATCDKVLTKIRKEDRILLQANTI